MTPVRIYAGIGSRKTPKHVLALMRQVGAEACLEGWLLRSGGAPGADSAFEEGCDSVDPYRKRIFLPKDGFNGRWVGDVGTRLIGGEKLQRAERLAASYHPAWSKLSAEGRRYHTRNSFQMLGANLSRPADAVVCWTEGGRGGGGTGQALRIARDSTYAVPVLDLGDPALDTLTVEDVLRWMNDPTLDLSMRKLPL